MFGILNMNTRNNEDAGLQLLKTFKAILEQQSVVGAAEARGITQSAISKHLARLRVWFGDELFVRTARGMQPTAKALSLAERIDVILHELALLSAETPFEPSRLRQNFVLATTDEIARRLLPRLWQRLQKAAPGLRLTLIPLDPDYAIRRLESGNVNLVIGVNWHAPEQLMQKHLFSDRFICLMSRHHPLAEAPLTMDAYAAASHLMVAPLGKQQGYIDDLLARGNRKRLVRLSVPLFTQIDAALLGDNHIVTLPERVAEDLARQGGFVMKELPFRVPEIDYYTFWHRRFRHEKLNIWMRGLISEIFREQDRRGYDPCP